MAKWYGNIGFTDTVETEPGVWESTNVTRPYFGELINNRWMRQSSGNVNDDINISNRISILADPYVMNHCSTMVYVEIMGAKWKVTSVDASQYPRLILDIGGLYNE